MRIYPVKSYLSFGHELDTQLDEAYKKWSKAYDVAAGYRKQVQTENEVFELQMRDLESSILKARQQESIGLKNIENKKNEIKDFESAIKEKEKIVNETLERIKIHSQKNNEKNEEYKSALESFLNLKRACTEKQAAKVLEVQNQYDKEKSAINNGIKAQLIKKIISPINKRFDDEPPKIASKVYIFDALPDENIDKDSVYQKLLFWTVKLTNSNYGMIDAKEYCNKSLNEFFENIKTILFQSNKMYEKNNRCSVTLLTNMQDLVPRFSQKENMVLQNLIDKSSEMFHNSFIIISKQNKKIKEFFPMKIRLDKFFMEDSRFGINSFTNILENKKLLGKNLQQILK